MLSRIGGGLGSLGLASVLSQQGLLGAESPLNPKRPHFAPRAKRIIHLFMNGGPSQVDTFDPKPELTKHHGEKPSDLLKTERRTGGLFKSPFEFKRHGQSGLPVSEIFPEVAKTIDDICVIRSMHTDVPNHEPSLLMMTCGISQPIRPSMGSWL